MSFEDLVPSHFINQGGYYGPEDDEGYGDDGDKEPDNDDEDNGDGEDESDESFE